MSYRGSYACPVCGSSSAVYRSKERWRQGHADGCAEFFPGYPNNRGGEWIALVAKAVGTTSGELIADPAAWLEPAGVPPVFRTLDESRPLGAQGWCPTCPRPDPRTHPSSAA